MKKSANSLKRVLIIIMIAFVYYYLTDSGRSKPSTSSTASTASVSEVPLIPASAAPVEEVWPFLRDGEQVARNVDEMTQVNYYLVVDGSGSMLGSSCTAGDTKMNAAKKAVARFGTVVPQKANLGLVTFSSEGVKEELELGQGNRNEFAVQVNKIDAGGGTPLRSAIEKAYERLTEQGRKQLGYGEYHLVVVTDGEASTGESPELIVNKILSYSPIVIHTIGFCIDEKHSLNQAGRTYYQAATNPEALAKGLANVLAEAPQFTASQFH